MAAAAPEEFKDGQGALVALSKASNNKASSKAQRKVVYLAGGPPDGADKAFFERYKSERVVYPQVGFASFLFDWTKKDNKRGPTNMTLATDFAAGAAGTALTTAAALTACQAAMQAFKPKALPKLSINPPINDPNIMFKAMLPGESLTTPWGMQMVQLAPKPSGAFLDLIAFGLTPVNKALAAAPLGRGETRPVPAYTHTSYGFAGKPRVGLGIHGGDCTSASGTHNLQQWNIDPACGGRQSPPLDANGNRPTTTIYVALTVYQQAKGICEFPHSVLVITDPLDSTARHVFLAPTMPKEAKAAIILEIEVNWDTKELTFTHSDTIRCNEGTQSGLPSDHLLLSV